jgi:hypothetical protein
MKEVHMEESPAAIDERSCACAAMRARVPNSSDF